MSGESGEIWRKARIALQAQEAEKNGQDATMKEQ